MKVIDLLNKIANGEKLPNKIKYGKLILEKIERSYEEIDYVNNEGYNLGGFLWLHNLNDEIEIIEEDKPIMTLADCIIEIYNLREKLNKLVRELNKEIRNLQNQIYEMRNSNELKERE